MNVETSSSTDVVVNLIILRRLGIDRRELQRVGMANRRIKRYHQSDQGHALLSSVVSFVAASSRDGF